MVWIHISLMASNVEQPFMCLLAIFVLSLKKFLFQSFVQFLIRQQFLKKIKLKVFVCVVLDKSFVDLLLLMCMQVGFCVCVHTQVPVPGKV